MSPLRSIANVAGSIVVAILSFTALQGVIREMSVKGFVSHSPVQIMVISGVLAVLSFLMVLTYRRPQAQGIGRRPSIAFSAVSVMFATASFILPAYQALGG
jgi:phosphatidylserine synthase